MTANDDNHALHYEENLLWEKERCDHPGVDLPAPAGMPLRTGQQAREDIGLPQVSEPQALRHFVRMSTWNYSIDHGFFPLGSCTMKHNPRLNEKLARLPGFAHLHPLQPESTTQGALALMYELQNWLAELTNLPGVCLSPAAGAHGELAGMMTIARAHEQKGQGAKRKIVLTPDSAHGTNPATATTCGFEVRNIPTKDTGMLTVEAFKEALYKTDPKGADIAGMMVTNPNTCGLFEKDIAVIADLLHEVGGYFYMDGANFNALVGKIRPGDFGVDVMHINLHKTFSTPHGGGGPGSGPICCTEELARYMPVPTVIKAPHLNPLPQGRGDSESVSSSAPSPHRGEGRGGGASYYYKLETNEDRPETCGRLKGFHGQFGMHVRALAYMLSHGADGLKQVSEDAVLNANYILRSLENDYHAPFAHQGPCMHEALLTDKRQKEQGVQTLDIAKALIEKGFHPMTVYFPLVVPGTMLIEPTETESKDSLDRFITAMKDIAGEAASRADAEEHFHAFPLSTPRRRLDEVKAARQPVLRWK
ncbi:MAG: aminomethyl-transferring glycine dehydrogenase subunit GcvPB [Rhodospirillales bacterium]|nr:aminomethyl-transferring glycine dehydrogenase subunit GcvPB [Rhodospirillales bacterium]